MYDSVRVPAIHPLVTSLRPAPAWISTVMEEGAEVMLKNQAPPQAERALLGFSAGEWATAGEALCSTGQGNGQDANTCSTCSARLELGSQCQ